MSLRALVLASVLTLPALTAACSKVGDETALPAATAEAAPAAPAELAGGPDPVGDAATRAAMDAAIAEALADAKTARTPPTVLVVSNAPIPNPGDPVRESGILRIAMLPVPNPEAAPPPAPALLGAPETEVAPAMELAGAPEQPRRVGAILETAAKPAPKPRAAVVTVAAAPAPKAAAKSTPVPASEPAPMAAAAVTAPPPPATPMEAVIATAAPPAPEDIQLPRVAAGVTPVDTGVTLSPLMWLSGLALLAVAAVFAAVRLARRDRDPIRA